MVFLRKARSRLVPGVGDRGVGVGDRGAGFFLREARSRLVPGVGDRGVADRPRVRVGVETRKAPGFFLGKRARGEYLASDHFGRKWTSFVI